MYFINRGNSSFLILAIVVLAFLFLINFLPYILLAGGVIWAISYVYKKIRNFNLNSESKVKMGKSNFNKGKEEDFKNFNNEKVIDVEYTEVK